MSSNFEKRGWHEIDDEYSAMTGCSPASVMFEHVRALEEDQVGIHAQNIINTRLYSNREPLMFDWNGELASSFRPLTKNIENLVQYTTDTLLARLVQPLKLAVYTRGADFDVYLKGRQLDKYLWGEYVALDINRKLRRIYLDALISGTGVLKVGIDEDRDSICVERVNPDEVVVDQRECLNDTEPSQIFHRRLVPRSVLRKLYASDPAKVAAIDAAQGKNFQYTSFRTPSDEQIVVIEAYKLGAKHMTCIENCVLSEEAWPEDNGFPFVFLRWADPAHGGFYGRSAVSDMIGYQIRHNEMNEDISYGQRVMCVPRVWIEQGSAITGTKLDNTIGREYFYRGTKPEAETWSAFNPELYNERERNKQACLEHFGLNPMMTSGKLPTQTRMDSSEAFREYNQINDDRFSDKLQAIEAAHVQLGHKMIAAAAKLFKNKGKSRAAVVRSGRLVEQIRWDEVDMDADKYILQVAATSITNMSPAARRDKANTWYAEGKISLQKYLSMSGEPDLEMLSQEAASPSEHIQYMIDEMLRGNSQVPDPHDNLAEGIKTVVSTYLHLRTLGAPEDILDLFRDWIILAENELNPEQDQLTQPPMPPGMAPPAQEPAMAPGGAPPMPAPGAPGMELMPPAPPGVM